MIVRAAILVAAVIAAIAPLPPTLIERWYSRAFYPSLQSVLTPITNRVSIALLDVGVLLLVIAIVVWFVRVRPITVRRVVTAGLTGAAVLYLLFVVTWGFNYRRVRLEEKLAFDRTRVTRDGVTRLANDAASRVNTLYVSGHAAPADLHRLEAAIADVQRALGDWRVFRPGVPKSSLLSLYFRKAAIDGMTDPFFLEIIVNPDLLPIERPMVLAHEWAHLAGYAHEADANFVAWLACLRGDGAAQYSGWLATYEHAVSALPRDARRTLTPLDAGPRADLRAMFDRYQRSSPRVRNAARGVYDSYLRANRVDEGIASYSAVLRLMLAVDLDHSGNPRLR